MKSERLGGARERVPLFLEACIVLRRNMGGVASLFALQVCIQGGWIWGGGGVRDGEKEGRGGGSFCPRCSPQELVAPGCFSFWPIDVDSSIHSIMLTASIFSRFYPPPSPSKKSCIPSISRLQLECALWGGEGRGGRKDGTGEGTGGDWVHLGGGC